MKKFLNRFHKKNKVTQGTMTGTDWDWHWLKIIAK